MKTLLTGLMCLALSTSLFAQDSKSGITAELTTTDVVFKSGNALYLKNVKSQQTATKIKKLQNMAAKYNIEDSKIYNPKNKVATYDVVFEEDNCKIIATYNNEGTIIGTKEQFNNMKLPYELIKEIAKMYPSWSFENNTQLVEYNKEDGATKIYVVEIKNNKNSKTLKFKLTDTASDQNDYVVVN